MSQENVEMLRSFYEAFNRGDIDAALAGAPPDFEIHDAPELPGGGIHRGGSGIPLDVELAHVFTMQDGHVQVMRAYTSKASALEAVGLSEEEAQSVGLSEQDAHADS